MPDRQLQRYLESEIPKRAQAMSLSLRQSPDAIIISPDKTYLGRISGQPKAASTAGAALTTKDLSSIVMSSIVANVQLDLSPKLQNPGRISGYFDMQDVVISAAAKQESFAGRTGFIASNIGVKAAAVTFGAKASLVTQGLVTSVLIETGEARNISVLIQFEDGSGTVAAAIPGYVGTIVADKGGVVSVNYTPSSEGGRAMYGDATRERLDKARANAAAAAQLGSFRADNPKDAARLAESIRVFKGIDPTLGLYTAYAYGQAGLLSKIRSVADNMRADLGLLLFHRRFY